MGFFSRTAKHFLSLQLIQIFFLLVLVTPWIPIKKNKYKNIIIVINLTLTIKEIATFNKHSN